MASTSGNWPVDGVADQRWSIKKGGADDRRCSPSIKLDALVNTAFGGGTANRPPVRSSLALKL